MNMLGSKKGAYAIAVALIVLFIMLVFITVSPALKHTVLDIIGAATANTP